MLIMSLLANAIVVLWNYTIDVTLCYTLPFKLWLLTIYGMNAIMFKSVTISPCDACFYAKSYAPGIIRNGISV